MQDLKSQIAAAEQQQAPPGQPLVAAKPEQPAAHLRWLPLSTWERRPAFAKSRTRIPDGAARINNEPMDRAMRGYFRLPGTGTLVKLGGFIKTDVFYDTNQAGTYYGAYVPSSFPDSPQPHTQNATVSARPSRFFTEFLQPVHQGEGTVKGYLEFDFLGNYERTSLRLRQFYAQYKNILAGQAWSAFGDPDAFPDTLEFEGLRASSPCGSRTSATRSQSTSSTASASPSSAPASTLPFTRMRHTRRVVPLAGPDRLLPL